MVFLIDNYDSFVYNLVQAFLGLGAECVVRRNDQVTLDEIEAARPAHLVISPGPCTPREAGISCDAIRRFAGKLPILGVCLGHQCMGEVFGGRVVRAPAPVHGRTSRVAHDGKTIFRGVPSPFEAARYHSLAIEAASFPEAELERTATSEDGVIMGVRHRRFAGTAAPLEGVQFHPESYMTEVGPALLRNFLEGAK
ncbi:MAG TPA: aminodeoxychorismate/anthranilate synthase component II [Planctomycetota bacterium]|nr:aminodeoxychorismate/anthranilate synthase component II [Planctomycetota bacterium]